MRRPHLGQLDHKDANAACASMHQHSRACLDVTML